MPDKVFEARVIRVLPTGTTAVTDQVAVESPLEIRVGDGTTERPLTLTMRSPGDDAELAAGFLFAEGVVQTRDDLIAVEVNVGTVTLTLSAAALARIGRAERSFVTTSACGVCGKADASTLHTTPTDRPATNRPRLSVALLARLPEALRAVQTTFAATGGLHAAGLFDDDGRLVDAREDVGRHNAVDKVVGASLLAGGIPARAQILVVSGRASFELVQKALMAQVLALVAVGAPSSAAIELAVSGGLTLVGFVRQDRLNVYAGAERIEGTEPHV